MSEQTRHAAVTSTGSDSHDTDIVNTAWARIRAHLERRRGLNYEEIKHYPAPIPGCDQQYNYLLEQRANICRELTRLDEAVNANLKAADRIKLVTDFIQSSSYVDAGAAQEIRSFLTEGR